MPLRQKSPPSDLEAWEAYRLHQRDLLLGCVHDADIIVRRAHLADSDRALLVSLLVLLGGLIVLGTRLAAALRGSEASRSLVVFRMIAVSSPTFATSRAPAHGGISLGAVSRPCPGFRRGSGGDPKANSTWSRPGFSSSLLAIIGLDVEGLTPSEGGPKIFAEHGAFRAPPGGETGDVRSPGSPD